MVSDAMLSSPGILIAPEILGFLVYILSEFEAHISQFLIDILLLNN